MYDSDNYDNFGNNSEGDFSGNSGQPHGQEGMGGFNESGEYHFTRGESTRLGYSDAGYVPSADAGNIPPRYHYTVEPPKEKKEKKEKPQKQKRGIGAAGLIAACLACAILGGAAGGAVTAMRQRPDASGTVTSEKVSTERSLSGEGGTTITLAEPANSVTPQVTTNTVASGGVMSATDIYNNLATSQVVAITTEITYTNIWGYSTTGAVSGSGFIISSDGYILTNNHVIEDAVKGNYEITVLLYDGTEYTAKVVGYDGDDSDVAVLKIDAEGLNAVTIGDSDALQVGEVVYAVGNPLGELQFSMSTGSVSALDREMTSSDGTSINMFQIDAAVNSGNSGGPVYNNRGEVIGVVTAKYATTGVEGLGFAIPINDAISIAEDLIKNGYVSGKAYIGILNPQDINATYAQYYNMVPGVYVYGVQAGSAAENAGLQPGDIVVGLNGEEVTTTGELNSIKRDFKAGDTTTIRVYRSGDYLDLDITFDEETPKSGSGDGAQTVRPQIQPGFGYGFGG